MSVQLRSQIDETLVEDRYQVTSVSVADKRHARTRESQ